MAKLNHVLFGQAKGKVGGVVLQRYEGMNIAREKPISVKNPQSTKQTKQRANFKLASQLVAQYIDVFNARLSKLSIYTRTRRATAVNAILGVITDEDPQHPTANVSSVIQAINEKNMSPLAGPIVTYDANTKIGRITATSDDAIVAIAIGYDSEGAIASREVIQYVSDGTAKATEATSGVAAVVMAVALRATTEDGRNTISNIRGMGSSWENAILTSVTTGDLEVTNITFANHN